MGDSVLIEQSVASLLGIDPGRIEGREKMIADATHKLSVESALVLMPKASRLPAFMWAPMRAVLQTEGKLQASPLHVTQGASAAADELQVMERKRRSALSSRRSREVSGLTAAVSYLSGTVHSSPLLAD